MAIIFQGKIYTETEIQKNKWLKYLYFTREQYVNLERVLSVEELSKGNHVLLYVERTLEIAKTHTELTEKEMDLVTTTLKWAEVSKCMMPEDRMRFQNLGFNLEIHNEASSRIYEMESDEKDAVKKEIIKTLIETHGLTGQYIRGENDLSVFTPLLRLVSDHLISKNELSTIWQVLDHAIIGAVNTTLYESIKEELKLVTTHLLDEGTNTPILSTCDRLKRLFPAFKRPENLTEEETILYEDLLKRNDLWYAESALDTFSRKEINTIFSYIYKDTKNTKHISFYRLSNTLTYDYEGSKKINVYKKRILELFLKELSEGIDDPKSKEHVQLKSEVIGDTYYFDIQFTKVCESLINFLVEAERSNIMTYEKSIQTIFDLFGFRRDIFDRLNNEDKYLETMNRAEESTKFQILDYIVGDKIVDVGSGGGVLLDILEKRYPDKTIIGTDISENVIEKLHQKIEEENHHYMVLRHNFVETPLKEPVSTILFSSILHEVYSYTEYEGTKFNIESVKKALKNAYDSLLPGGRIVIRDGVMSEKSDVKSVRFRDASGLSFINSYLKDFQGLRSLRNPENKEQWNDSLVSIDSDILTADVNFIREALYTYTWGSESYAQEVKEQFGYFTLNEYVQFLQKLGMKIQYQMSFTEPGYPENLNPLIELLPDLTWEELPSTCIIAAEK